MRLRGRAVRTSHVSGQMNKLEAKYAAHLAVLAGTGALHSWRFEPIKLRLADRTFYTPDFLIVRPRGEMSFVEVKGFWEDDARVKIKVAAELFPEFVFLGVTWSREKGWCEEEF